MNIDKYLEKNPRGNRFKHMLKGNQYIKSIEMIKVSDQWYPNFPGDYVCMKFIKSINNSPICILIKGMDDFSMSKTYDFMKEAKIDYFKILKLKVLNQGILDTMGFISF